MIAPDNGSRWREWCDLWRYVFRGPYTLRLALVCMACVVSSTALTLADPQGPDLSALINGVAAVVCALAAIIEATHGGKAKSQLADHEARIRVLESK